MRDGTRMRWFTALAGCIVFMSGAASAQNMHQKYDPERRGMWSCASLSAHNDPGYKKYNKCKECESKGEDYVRTGTGPGRCDPRTLSDKLREDMGKRTFTAAECEAHRRTINKLAGEYNERSSGAPPKRFPTASVKQIRAEYEKLVSEAKQFCDFAK